MLARSDGLTVSDRPRFARLLAILLCGAVAFWAATGVTLSLVASRTLPGLALAWWPWGNLPKISLGTEAMLAGSISRTRVAAIRQMATEAVIREPVNSYGLSLLAAFADFGGDKAGARRLFEQSERISRRNTVTQMWLIEDAVRREDVAGAVRHYDMAMRTSVEVRETLLPILVSAGREPEVREPLLQRLAARPRWWQDFAWKVATESDSPELIDATTRAVRPNLDDARERTLAERSLSRLVTLKSYGVAVRLANFLEGLPEADRTLRNGAFESDEGLLPLAWKLREEGSLRSFRDRVPNGTMGLRIVTNSGSSGVVASQMTGLSPGHYSISGESGQLSEVSMSKVRIDISCVEGASLARFAVPFALNAAKNFQFRVEVPGSGCAAQRFDIVTSSAVDTDAWLDNLRVGRGKAE